ncbi:hypothetical protein BKA93DRAFT_765822 [Sparassis latifolia]
MPLNDMVRQRLQPLTAAMTSNRIFLYFVFSVLAVVGAVANACRNHSNFYSVTVYLSRSGRSVLILANFGFILSLLCGRLLQRLFFGPLQAREVERLYDQTWMFVTESLLAFTIFRDDFDIPFVLMFGFLLFVKCFHWLAQDRVESMDQTTYPGPPTLFHIRMVGLFGLLFWTDLLMFVLAVESTYTNGIGGMVLFASEYAILMASVWNATARYTLSVLDFRRARTRGGENAPPWEHKSMYVFYVELATDFLKLTTYLAFFMIILTFYGLPLNIVRDVYLTARSFITRVRALVRYRNATRDMDRRYPNATEADLSETSDRTCIICREEMVVRDTQQPAGAGPAAPAPVQQDGPNMTPKKLPCGHIFHFQCLRSWLERQQSCPTCRRPVLEPDPRNPGQAQARQPGVPQPGAVPQPGQQPVQAAGWLGRILGFVVPQPLVAGPMPHGQWVPVGALPQQQQQQQQQGNFGWAPGQVPPPPPPGYYYPVQYPLPPPQPQQLQPPPVFRGFYGPGGVWQPWVDPQWLAQQQNPQAQAPAQTPQQRPQQSRDTTPISVGDATRPRVSLPGAPPVPTATAPTASAASGSAPAATDRPSTPRDAAATAALPRLNPSGSVTEAPPLAAVSGGPVNSPPVRASVPTPTTTTVSPPSVAASESTSPAISTSTDNAGWPTPQPPHNHDGVSGIPSLLPLYDFGPLTGRAPRSPPNGYPGYLSSAPSPYFRGTGTPSGPQPPQPRTYRPALQQQGGQRTLTRAVVHDPRTPLSQLPATITDAQLARLDRLTREAIDERLRVLEGVSGAVYRCIEELTRVRSVLPISAAVGHAPDQERTATGSATASVSTTTPASGSSGSKTNVETATDVEPPVATKPPRGAPVRLEPSESSEERNDVDPGSQDGDTAVLTGSSPAEDEAIPLDVVE